MIAMNDWWSGGCRYGIVGGVVVVVVVVGGGGGGDVNCFSSLLPS